MSQLPPPTPYRRQNSMPSGIPVRRPPLRSSPLTGPAVSSDGTVTTSEGETGMTSRAKPSRILSTPELQTLATLSYHPSSMPSPPPEAPLFRSSTSEHRASNPNRSIYYSHDKKEKKKSFSTSSFSIFAGSSTVPAFPETSPTLPTAPHRSFRYSSRSSPPPPLSSNSSGTSQHHYPRAHFPDTPSQSTTSEAQGQGGSNWLLSNTYAVTPNFSRLGMRSPGIVMPVSAKSHRKTESQPLPRSSSTSSIGRLKNSKSSTSLRSSRHTQTQQAQGQVQARSRVHSRSSSSISYPSIGAVNGKSSTKVPKSLYLSKSTTGLYSRLISSPVNGRISSTSTAAMTEGRNEVAKPQSIDIDNISLTLSKPDVVLITNTIDTTTETINTTNTTTTVPAVTSTATDTLDVVGTDGMDSEASLMLDAGLLGQVEDRSSSLLRPRPKSKSVSSTSSLLVTRNHEEGYPIGVRNSVIMDPFCFANADVELPEQVQASLSPPPPPPQQVDGNEFSDFSCDDVGADLNSSNNHTSLTSTSSSIGLNDGGSFGSNAERESKDDVDHTCHPSVSVSASNSLVCLLSSSSTPPPLAPLTTTPNIGRGSISEDVEVEANDSEQDKADLPITSTAVDIDERHIDGEQRIMNFTSSSISVHSRFRYPRSQSQSQSDHQALTQSQPTSYQRQQHKNQHQLLSSSSSSLSTIKSITGCKTDFSLSSKSRKASLGSLSLSSFKKKVMQKRTKSLSSLKSVSSSHMRSNSDGDSTVLGAIQQKQGQGSSGSGSGRVDAEVSLWEGKKRHKGKGVTSFLSFGSTAEAHALTLADEEVPPLPLPLPEPPTSAQQLFPHDLLEPEPSSTRYDGVERQGKGQCEGNKEVDSEFEDEDDSEVDEDLIAAERLLEEVMSFNQPVLPSRRSNITLSRIDVEAASVKAQLSRVEVAGGSDTTSPIDEEITTSEDHGPPWRPSSPPCQTMDHHAAALGKRTSSLSGYSHLSTSVRSLPSHSLDRQLSSLPERTTSIRPTYSHFSTSARSLPSRPTEHQSQQDISPLVSASRAKRSSILSSFSHVSNSAKSVKSLHGAPSPSSSSSYRASVSRPTSLTYASESSISSSPPHTPTTPTISVPPLPAKAKSRAGKQALVLSFDTSQGGAPGLGNGMDSVVNSFPGDVTPVPIGPIPPIITRSVSGDDASSISGRNRRDRTSKAIRVLGVEDLEQFESQLVVGHGHEQPPKSVVSQNGLKSSSPKSSLETQRHSMMGMMRRTSRLGMGTRSQSFNTGGDASGHPQRGGGSVKRFWKSLTSNGGGSN
ncbi:hypothetical protein K435DRAFT_856585 [Dendrothele bispora CBS 962.96]|uniref:Uncharacterized protein n=1 Tax=Dendrothele bispora (strain CBS 962.96) TaxID=1314807 RepID=A0A4S8M7Y7_DENBC|nr:hypothetical protein K435DRAFT_856585 [Dendrothele bispora CBS 962.96]